VRNDAGVAAVEEGVRRLREGRTLLIFPKGTDAVSDSPVARGRGHIGRAGATSTRSRSVRPRTLMKGQRWHDVPDGPFELTVRVLPPIAPGDVALDGASPSVAARRLTDALRERLLAALREAPAPA
jgi:1-acyl-sn-glycerol-3-phosphate acyltransferase